MFKTHYNVLISLDPVIAANIRQPGIPEEDVESTGTCGIVFYSYAHSGVWTGQDRSFDKRLLWFLHADVSSQ